MTCKPARSYLFHWMVSVDRTFKFSDRALFCNFQDISRSSDSWHKCHLCKFRHKKPQMLLWHLSYKHFKDAILAKNNLDWSSRICPICKKSFKFFQNMIIHLAQRHNQLQGLVDDKVLTDLKKSIEEFHHEKKVTWRQNDGHTLSTRNLSKYLQLTHFQSRTQFSHNWAQ